MTIQQGNILSEIARFHTRFEPVHFRRLWKSSTGKWYFFDFFKQDSQSVCGNIFSLAGFNFFKSSSKDQTTKPLTQKTILVAEDDDYNFNVIKACLKSKNYDLIHAKNGAEAVRIYESNKDIALVLMDIQMPVMDGITATRKIRQLDKSVPVIAQTAYAMDNIKSVALEAGCSDFITKPLKAEVLSNKINQYIA